MTKANDCFAEMRDLLDDPSGDFATDEYLCRKLNLGQDELLRECLSIPILGALMSFVTLANVPIGTTSLAAYFAASQPLERLEELITFKERAIDGTRSDSDYIPLIPAMSFPSIEQGPYNRQFIWKTDDILLPGATQLLDLQILGKFKPGRIVTKDSIIPAQCDGILKYRGIEIAAMSRGNSTLALYCKEKADSMQSAYVNTAIQQLQQVPTRMRSFSGRMRRFVDP